MVGKGQFSLASLFVATTFVALASMAARNFVLGTDPFDRLVAWFVLPVFVCGVIGALRNQLRAWHAAATGPNAASLRAAASRRRDSASPGGHAPDPRASRTANLRASGTTMRAAR